MKKYFISFVLINNFKMGYGNCELSYDGVMPNDYQKVSKLLLEEHNNGNANWDRCIINFYQEFKNTD